MCFFLEYWGLDHTHIANTCDTLGSWDDWVPQDRIRKDTEEHRELAANLKAENDKHHKPKISTSAKKRAAGSDLSSTRGSEERLTPATGRGQKRGRDYEIEKVRERLLAPYRDQPTVFPTSMERTPMPEPDEEAPEPKRPKFTGEPWQEPSFHKPKASNKKPQSLKKYPHDKDEYERPERCRVIGDTLNGCGAAPPLLSKPTESKEPKEPKEPSCERKTGRHRTLSKRAAETRVQSAKAKPKANKKTAKQWEEPITSKKSITKRSVQSANEKIITIQEETFNQRPAIHLPVPDHLKSLLVDDWEFVTKNLSLIPLPAQHPVNEVVNAYYEEEKARRRMGSAEADILQEVASGVKDYFEKCLGKILLYRFERQQYAEIYEKMEAGQEEWEGKSIGDIYGVEHLARLLGMSFLSLHIHDFLIFFCAGLGLTSRVIKFHYRSSSRKPTWMNNQSKSFGTR